MEQPELERKVNAISKAHRLGKPLRADAIETILNYVDFQEYKLNRLYGLLQDMQTLPVERLSETGQRIVAIIRRVNGW